MYTTIRHDLRHTMKAWPGTLADPCILSGSDRSKEESASSYSDCHDLIIPGQWEFAGDVTNQTLPGWE